MGAADDDVVTAEQVAPWFNCSTRQVVDRLSKEPGFPLPIKRRPLTWTRGKVLEYREAIQVGRQARRR